MIMLSSGLLDKFDCFPFTGDCQYAHDINMTAVKVALVSHHLIDWHGSQVRGTGVSITKPIDRDHRVLVLLPVFGFV